MRLRGLGVSACLLAASLGAASHGRAEAPGDVERAERLFREARALVESGDFVAACPKFQASLEIVEGIGTMYNLADCWERIGRTASAQRLFLRAAGAAEEAGQAERERVARERAAKLEPGLSKVVIQAPAEGTRVELSRADGTGIALAPTPGRPLPVDPGSYRVAAFVNGKQTWSSALEVPKKPGIVSVEVPAEKPEAATAAAKPKPEPKPEAEPESRRRAGSSARKSEPPAILRHASLALGGVGAGALLAGAAFQLQYRASNSDAKDVCPASFDCTAEQIAEHDRLVDDARRARTWSYLGLSLGGAALAGAGVLYFTTAPSSESAVEADAGVDPSGGWSARVRGKF